MFTKVCLFTEYEFVLDHRRTPRDLLAIASIITLNLYRVSQNLRPILNSSVISSTCLRCLGHGAYIDGVTNTVTFGSKIFKKEINISTLMLTLVAMQFT